MSGDSFLSGYTSFYWPTFADIFIVGSFTDWKTFIPLTANRYGEMHTTLKLPVGVHQYLFQVDGEWFTDPNNAEPLIDGYNQVEVLPALPQQIPRSLLGNSLNHLFLRFHPSATEFVQDFIIARGFKNHLISIIILEPEITSACALTINFQSEKDVIESLNGELILPTEHKLNVKCFFKDPVSLQAAIGDIEMCSSKVVITSPLPEYVVPQHVKEHFSIFSPHIIAVEKDSSSEKGFSIIFASLANAKEAVSAYDNSLLQGAQIQVRHSQAVLVKAEPESKIQTHDQPVLSYDPQQLDDMKIYVGDFLLPISTPTASGFGDEQTKLFIYANPKFPKSVSKKHLMEHFHEFHPVDAYLIKISKTKNQTGTGVVVLPSKCVAESAIAQMQKTKILDCSISLKLEDPSPPKAAHKDHKRKFATSDMGAPQGSKDLICLSSSSKSHPQNASSGCDKLPTKQDQVTAKNNSCSIKKQPSHLLPVPPKRLSETGTCISSQMPKAKELLPAESSSEECSVKVSYLPQATTANDLRKLFERVGEMDGAPVLHLKGHPPYAHVNFKSPISAQKALNLCMPKVKGVNVTVRSSTKARKSSLASHPEVDDVVSIPMKLTSSEWNTLMTRTFVTTKDPNSTLLGVILAPYPDVAIEPSFKDSTLNLKGKRKTVLSARDDITKSIKGELPIDRLELEGLVYLKPSLPREIKKSIGVHVTGFEVGSEQVRFDGTVRGITKAHETFSILVSELSKYVVELEGQFPLEQLSSLREILKDEKYCLCSPQSPPWNVLVVYTLNNSEVDTDKVASVANSFLVSVKPLDCSPDEVAFLCYFARLTKSDISAKITVEHDKVFLQGTHTSIEESEKTIKNTILTGVYCRKFSYSCSSRFVSQIENRILDPRKKEENTFEWKSVTGISDSDRIDIVICSRSKDTFTRACDLLAHLDPRSTTFSIQKCSQDIIAVIKQKLEDKYMVRICFLDKSASVLIDGLCSNDIEESYEQLRDEIKSVMQTNELVSISKYQYKFLSRFHVEDLNELNKYCKELVLFSPNKENKSYYIAVTGSIKQVEDVKTRLNSGLLEKRVCGESFCLSCPSDLSKMWCKRWEQVKAQEESKYSNRLLIDFEKSSHLHQVFKTIFNFDIISREDALVQSIKDDFSNEGTEIVDDTVPLPKAGIKLLLEARETNSMEFINNFIICITHIDELNDVIGVCTPKALAKDLATGVKKISEFVLANSIFSEFIISKDPVVGLVMSSDTHRGPHFTKVCEEADRHNVSVTKVPGEEMILKITGKGTSVVSAKDAICKVGIVAIEETIGLKLVEIEPILHPLLTTTDFTTLKVKLESEHCVICSPSLTELKNELICTGYFQTQCSSKQIADIHILKGNVVLESVDAIVNITNEELDHDDGLAQVISEHGGPMIRSECRGYIQFNSKLRPGNAVCLGGGSLSCKHIIHAVVPNLNEDHNFEEETLFTAISESLKLACDNLLSSIAIPALCITSSERAYAETLLRVVEDHYKEFSLSSVRNIRLVLPTQSTADVFTDVITSSKFVTLVERPSKFTSVRSNPKYNWKWLDNDGTTYSPYSSDENDVLSLAYSKNPHGSCTIIINFVSYTVNFMSMKQTNDKTGFSRDVTKSPMMNTELARPVEWLYWNDKVFTSYIRKDSEAIENMYQAKMPTDLTIKSTRYSFDFKAMEQKNVRTGYRRRIQRCEEVERVISPSSINLTLRGPRSNLPFAETMLMDTLNKFITSHSMETLPHDLPPELEKRIEEITATNCVSFEVSEMVDKTSQTLCLKGVDCKVQSAIIEIQEEIIKFNSLARATKSMVTTRPPEWGPQKGTVEVFDVARGSQEWTEVEKKFGVTMTCPIAKIARIQNEFLWKKYTFQKKLLEEKNEGNVNEKELFHGSRNNKPKDIYEGESGFDMRYSRTGMWGQANYFAVNASYSNSYAHTEFETQSSVTRYIYNMDGHTKQMFLVKVLTGESFECSSDQTLRMPPVKPNVFLPNTRYDSVKGYTNGSWVYMTYDNEKAYPAYLITYT